MKAPEFHRIAPETRKKLIKGWHHQAFSVGVVQEGQIRRLSQVSLTGSQRLMTELKSILQDDYFDKFTHGLEDLIGEIIDGQFICSWEKIEKALDNAVGENTIVKPTHDYFANKSPEV